MKNVRIRPLTVLLVIVAVMVNGVEYVTTTAGYLPSFFPGHASHSTHAHYKHGLAAFTLAVFVLGAAWFTTAPDRAASA